MIRIFKFVAFLVFSIDLSKSQTVTNDSSLVVSDSSTTMTLSDNQTEISTAAPSSLTTLSPENSTSGIVSNDSKIDTTVQPITTTMTSPAPSAKVARNCDEQLLTVDSCIKRIVLIGDREAVIPKTIQELEDNHCNRIKGELLCVRDYGRTCLKLFPRTIFTIVRKNVERVYKSLCQTVEGKTTAIKHFNCFKPDNLPVLHSVVDRITTSLEYIQFNVTDNDILPSLCCAFYTFYHETKIIVDNICFNTTGPETSDFVVNLVKAVVTDALDLGCGRYGSYQKCTENLPSAVRIFTNILRLNSSEIPIQNDTIGDLYTFSTSAKKYSPVVPMIGISKRLDSDF